MTALLWCPILSCGHEAGKAAEGEAAVGFRTRTTAFTWVRSVKDPVRWTLRTQWVLTGAAASEVGEEKGAAVIRIENPFITYYPVPADTRRRVTVESPEGVFREAVHRISFSPAALIQASRPQDTGPPASMVTGSLVFDTRKNTAAAEGDFTAAVVNALLTGTGLSYDMEKNTVVVRRNVRMEISSPRPCPDPGSLPPYYRAEINAFLEKEYHAYAEKNGLDVHLLAAGGPAVCLLDAPSVKVRGRPVFSSPALRLSSDVVTVRAARGNGEVLLDTAEAEGNVVFEEKTGERRRVTCTRLVYSLSAGRIVMTGDPELTRGATRVRSHRITYLVRTAEFLFAKPFTVIHRGKKAEKSGKEQ